MKKVYCDVCGEFIYETVEGAYTLKCNHWGFLPETDLCDRCIELIDKEVMTLHYKNLKSLRDRLKNEPEEKGDLFYRKVFKPILNLFKRKRK